MRDSAPPLLALYRPFFLSPGGIWKRPHLDIHLIRPSYVVCEIMNGVISPHANIRNARRYNPLRTRPETNAPEFTAALNIPRRCTCYQVAAAESQPTNRGAGGWGRGVPCAVFFCEIGDAPGSGRPGDIRDKQSIRCPHAGFGPPLFNDIPPIIVVARLNARHILRILRDKVGI